MKNLLPSGLEIHHKFDLKVELNLVILYSFSCENIDSSYLSRVQLTEDKLTGKSGRKLIQPSRIWIF